MLPLLGELGYILSGEFVCLKLSTSGVKKIICSPMHVIGDIITSKMIRICPSPGLVYTIKKNLSV